MAETKAKKEVKEEGQETPFDYEAYMKERVPFYAFKDNGKYKDDIVVGVNGKVFQIKRGERVMIPRYVEEVIVHSMEQDSETADMIDGYKRQYEEMERVIR